MDLNRETSVWCEVHAYLLVKKLIAKNLARETFLRYNIDNHDDDDDELENKQNRSLMEVF